MSEETWLGSQEQEQEVVRKLKSLVDEAFAGDYELAFKFYAGTSPRMNKSQMTALFIDAGIGSRLTRWLYIREAMKALDLDNDSGVSFEEFAARLP